MANMVKSTKYTNDQHDILIAPELAFALSCVYTNTGVTANSEGRKIIKAGTPVYVKNGKSILEDREELVTVSSTTTGETNTANVLVGIARHTIDVTNGNTNDAVIITGFVDLYKLDSDVQTALTSSIKASLKNDIKFIKGAK